MVHAGFVKAMAMEGAPRASEKRAMMFQRVSLRRPHIADRYLQTMTMYVVKVAVL